MKNNLKKALNSSWITINSKNDLPSDELFKVNEESIQDLYKQFTQEQDETKRLKKEIQRKEEDIYRLHKDVEKLKNEKLCYDFEK